MTQKASGMKLVQYLKLYIKCKENGIEALNFQYDYELIQSGLMHRSDTCWFRKWDIDKLSVPLNLAKNVICFLHRAGVWSVAYLQSAKSLFREYQEQIKWSM